MSFRSCQKQPACAKITIYLQIIFWPATLLWYMYLSDSLESNGSQPLTTTIKPPTKKHSVTTLIFHINEDCVVPECYPYLPHRRVFSKAPPPFPPLLSWKFHFSFIYFFTFFSLTDPHPHHPNTRHTHPRKSQWMPPVVGGGGEGRMDIFWKCTFKH